MKKRNRFIVVFLGMMYLFCLVLFTASGFKDLFTFVAIPILTFIFLLCLIGILNVISWMITGDVWKYFDKITGM